MVFFQRRPIKHVSYSMEKSFAALRSMLGTQIESTVEISRYVSTAIWRCLYNAVEASLRQGDVNHITGDVHYISYFLRKRRTVLTIHDCGFEQKPSRLKRTVLLWFWLLIPLRRVALVITDSEFTKGRIVSLSGCKPAMVRVIYICISPTFYRIDRTFNSERPTALIIGTNPNKNLDRVFSALKGLKCNLLIIGGLTEDHKAALDSNELVWTNRIGISEEGLLEAYANTDFLIFASTYEGFGMPIVEANIVGRAVITSNIASMPEVAMDAACLVDPYDVGSIRQGIERIINDSPYREELVERGFHNAERFRPELIAKQHLKIYEEIASSSRKSRTHPR